MNTDFLKNPIYAGAVGFILTILYIYFKNLSSDKESVDTSEYFITSTNSLLFIFSTTFSKCSRFLHKCYIESAREMFKNPYLFMNDLDYKTTQKNMRDALELISISIENSI